jgi:hypothetical protein
MTNSFDSSRCRVALLPGKNVDDVDLATRMFPAHMGPHIWRVLGPECAVRTVEARWLAAREFQMMLEIVTPFERPAAFRAGIYLSASLPRMLGPTGRPIRTVSMLRSRSVLAFWKIHTSITRRSVSTKDVLTTRDNATKFIARYKNNHNRRISIKTYDISTVISDKR